MFVVSGILKINHAADLAATIAGFQLHIPGAVIAVLAVALPPLEILLGLYLTSGFLLFAASTTAFVLLLIFIAVLISVVLRGLAVPCGCFGPGDTEPTTWATVGRDAIAALLPAYLMWWSQRHQRLFRRA